MAVTVALGVLAQAADTSAQAGSDALGTTTLSWNRDPEALVVSYRDIWAEIANQDTTPLIHVFGDGRVLVHYPDYTPKAGEYELRLTSPELENLLFSLVANGLATFDPRAVIRLRASEELRRWEAALAADRPPEFFMVADDSTSVFELHLASFRAADSALTSGAVHRRTSWLGLGTDAERYPGIESIQRLRAAELELRALLERADLRRAMR